MLTFLQRWFVLHALYKLCRRRNLVVWVEEHDLCSWVSGQDLKTHMGRDSVWDRFWFKVWYIIFRVHTHNELYQKVRNVLFNCEQIEPPLIRRTKNDDGISDAVALSWRGEEMYGVTYLLFGNKYAEKFWTTVLAGLVVLYAGWTLNKYLPTEPLKIEPVKVQVEYIYPPNPKG